MGENISRTSSLVVVISPIGPCSDPGDELTMTAHCAPTDVRMMMMIETIIILKMGILNQAFHCDLPRVNLMTKHKAWLPDGCGVLRCEYGHPPSVDAKEANPKDQKRSILVFARN